MMMLTMMMIMMTSDDDDGKIESIIFGYFDFSFVPPRL